MREFRDPIISLAFPQFKKPKNPRSSLERIDPDAASVTKDGDELARKPKRARGISSQRLTLLTAGSAAGQETRRRTLLGGAG